MMSLDKRGEKTIKRATIGRKPKLKNVDGMAGPELVSKLAETSISLEEVVDRLKRDYDISVTIPTVSSYLKAPHSMGGWGKKYDEKKKEMNVRRSKVKRWRLEYELARQGVSDIFKADYLSTDDGVFYNNMDNTITSLPRVEERAYKGKDIINYSKPGDFGWTPDANDPDALGTANHSVLRIMRRQLKKRIDGIVEEEKRKRIEEETKRRLENLVASGQEIDSDDIPKIMRTASKDSRKALKPELEALDKTKDEKLEEITAQIAKGDVRTRILHGEEIFNKKLDPAFASSSKKWRGRQRMLAEPGETFGRISYNLPFLLWMHPKRVQVHGHNLAKDLPELLNAEEPIVKAKYNDIPGINGKVRFPRNAQEYVQTQEAGMVVTEDFAKKFRYFTVVEEGSMIAEKPNGFPTAPRVNKKIKLYKDYERETDVIKGTYPIDRLDPLTLGGFEELGAGVGNKFAKHSGELFLVGEPRERRRKITLAQGEESDDIREVVYYSQDYQIVREDVLKVGDKILDRGGLKGVVSDIVPSLGKADDGKPYDLVCNYDEVWRESKDPLEDETYLKLGKKKSAIVLEHEAGGGNLFFFMIDKFAQDSTTTGLSFSPTLVSGLWEWALDGLTEDSESARDELINSFASRYFRGEGNIVPTLKALHYKAVKRGDMVTLEIDDKEPTADDFGDVVDLPHTYAGNTYQKAYVPHSVARVYFDGRTFREVFISQKDKTPNDASDFYWFNIMKQTKNRFGLFPKMDWGIQLVTRPWCEDPKDPTKYHTVEMDYLDVIDMGGDPYNPDLKVTFRKEPVTGKESVQTHPVKVDFTGKVRGCYDVETEVLTDKGWMFFKDLDGKEKIATLNPKTYELEYQYPSKVIGYEHKDKMYKLKTKMLDLMVTPDHRMFVAPRDGNFKIELAEEMIGKRRKFATTAEWNGFEQEFITFPSVERTHEFSSRNQYTDFQATRNITFGEKTFRMDDWIEFLGYYLTEGYSRRDSEIVIAQTKQENRDKIISVIRRLGYEPNITDENRIMFSDIVIALYLQEFGKATEKYIPRDILDLSKRQLKILYDAMMLGDGAVDNHTAFYTSSKQMADDFQELCLKMGISASIYERESRESYIDGRLITSDNIQYTVNIRQKRKTHMVNYTKDKQDEWVDYYGMVYCVEVPNHIIYVRRGGKPIWCGNTLGMNPTVALEATIDYDGDTVVAFVPVIEDAIVKLEGTKAYDDLKALKNRKFNEKFETLYTKAKDAKIADTEGELGIMCASYNQNIAETENELIERLGGLRKRSMILQGKELPPVVTIGAGSKYEEKVRMDMEIINKVTDVEKILKMREPRWKVKRLEKKPIDTLTPEEWGLVRDSYLRKELSKLVQTKIKDKGVKKLYDLLREPSEYMKKEFMTKTGEGDPIGLKLDTRSRLLDRILYNELRESDIFEDLTKS